MNSNVHTAEPPQGTAGLPPIPGTPAHLHGAKPCRRPSRRRAPLRHPPAKGFHSVTGDVGGALNAFVVFVFEPAASYPEYLVTYRSV